MFLCVLSEKAGIFVRNLRPVIAWCPITETNDFRPFTAKVDLSKAFFEICQLIVTTMQGM